MGVVRPRKHGDTFDTTKLGAKVDQKILVFFVATSEVRDEHFASRLCDCQLLIAEIFTLAKSVDGCLLFAN